MTTHKNAADNCHCDTNTCEVPQKKPEKKSFLSGIFKKCAACAGSGAAGLIAGHAGCIIAPVVIASAGLTTATAGMSVLALAFGAAVTAGGLYLWHRLRGQTASKWEKRIVIGSALAGMALSSAFHLASSHGDHHQHHAPQVTVTEKQDSASTPAPVAPVYQPAPMPGHQHHH